MAERPERVWHDLRNILVAMRNLLEERRDAGAAKLLDEMVADLDARLRATAERPELPDATSDG